MNSFYIVKNSVFSNVKLYQKALKHNNKILKFDRLIDKEMFIYIDKVFNFLEENINNINIINSLPIAQESYSKDVMTKLKVPKKYKDTILILIKNKYFLKHHFSASEFIENIEEYKDFINLHHRKSLNISKSIIEKYKYKTSIGIDVSFSDEVISIDLDLKNLVHTSKHLLLSKKIFGTIVNINQNNIGTLYVPYDTDVEVVISYIDLFFTILENPIKYTFKYGYPKCSSNKIGNKVFLNFKRFIYLLNEDNVNLYNEIDNYLVPIVAEDGIYYNIFDDENLYKIFPINNFRYRFNINEEVKNDKTIIEKINLAKINILLK